MFHQMNRASLQSPPKILCVLLLHLLPTHSISGAVCSPVIRLAGIDRFRGRVVLQCESKGWHQEPDVFWLDGEGNLLSAGPTETVKGPDGLYTVSSRVTVENKHSNSFTCKVRQNNINQTRETNIDVPDDFFKVQSSSSPAVIGLAVSLVVCIVVVVAVFFFGWKWRKNMIKTKRSCWDETDGGGNKRLSKSDDPEMQPLNAVDTDGATLTQHKEEAESEIKLRAELEIKNKKIENKHAECDLLMKMLQLHEENQRREERDLLTLKENLETKIKELKTMKPARFSSWSSKEKEAEKEKEVETLKKELQTKQEEFEDKNKEIKEKQAELQQLCDENQRKEIDLQRQTEETNNKELDRKQDDTDRLLQEKQKREEEVKDLKKKQTQDASKRKDTNPAGKNSTELPIFVEISPHGKYLRLTNKSKEDLKLEGWKLRVTLNNQNPIMFTFKESIKLRAEKKVTIWASGFGTHLPPSDLRWKDLNRWAKADKLLVELINCHEEIVKTTEV